MVYDVTLGCAQARRVILIKELALPVYRIRSRLRVDAFHYQFAIFMLSTGNQSPLLIPNSRSASE